MIKKYLQLYVKVFLYFSLSFGAAGSIILPILVGLFLKHSWHLIISEIGRTASLIWFVSIVSGFLFSLLGVTFHILRVRSLPTHEPDNISPIQTRSLRLAIDQETSFKICASSLMVVTAKIIKQEKPIQIKAQTPFGWQSYGESIEFTLARINNFETHVKFTSQPRLRTILDDLGVTIDFGRNTEIVEKIYWYLEEKSK